MQHSLLCLARHIAWARALHDEQGLLDKISIFQVKEGTAFLRTNPLLDGTMIASEFMQVDE